MMPTDPIMTASKPLSAAELEAIRERLDGISPDRWKHFDYLVGASVRSDIGRLLAEVARLRARPVVMAEDVLMLRGVIEARSDDSGEHTQALRRILAALTQEGT